MSAGSGARRSLAPYFPLPLVGAAVLLAVLILVTPNLLSSGSPSAGSAESQAELLIDRAPSGTNVTHVYLRGLGLARYAAMALAIAPYPGPGAPASPSGLPGTVVVNGTEVLAIAGASDATSFVVNATATFVDSSGASVAYAGVWAFSWSSGLLVTTAYGPVGGAGPTSASALPLTLLLAEGSGSPGP